MSESNLDKSQKFSGQGRSANPLTPRTLRPGGTQDSEEAVDLKPIDRSRPRGLNENAIPGSVTGHDPSRATGTGNQPYARQRDDTKNNTTPIFDSTSEWGRSAPTMQRISWEAQAGNPGRAGPLDPTNLNPPRPDFGAPSNASSDVRGPGEGEVNLETGPSGGKAQALGQGAAEKQTGIANAQRNRQLDIEQQRATSDVALQGAQTEEAQQNIRRQKAMMDTLFTPKPDAQATHPTDTATLTPATGAAPSATGVTPSGPMRTDFERLVDQSDLPDDLKLRAKMVGKFAAQTGKPESGLDFFWKQLDKESKSVVPHVLFDHGLPYGVVNKFGEVHDLEDPAMPPELTSLADSAKQIYAKKSLLLPDEVTNTNAQNRRPAPRRRPSARLVTPRECDEGPSEPE